MPGDFKPSYINKRLACSTWSVTAVTCDLDFVGTSILAQLTAVLIVRPCLAFARRMCALLCFGFCHDFPLSFLFDATPAQRWMQGPATSLDREWPQTGIRRRSYREVLLRPMPRQTGSDISRLATPLRTVVSSAQTALNLARRPPAARDRAMNSPIVARDVGGFPGKKQCVLNRTR